MSKLIGDGKTDNAACFEETFAACRREGLGSVRLEAGTYLVSRTVAVPKEISLHLEPGARIKLREAGLDMFPLFRGDDARHEIERKNALRALGIAIHVERHALPHEGHVGIRPAGVKLRRGEPREALGETAVLRAHRAVRREHFVVDSGRRVRLEKRGGVHRREAGTEMEEWR